MRKTISAMIISIIIIASICQAVEIAGVDIPESISIGIGISTSFLMFNDKTVRFLFPHANSVMMNRNKKKNILLFN